MPRDGIPSKCNCCGAHFINREAEHISDIVPLDFCRQCTDTGKAADWFWEEYIIGSQKTV